MKRELLKMYRLMESRYGDLGWWPASTEFEIMAGAILTQNTAWTNVEKAVRALKERKLLSAEKIAGENARRLGKVIKPSGYYNIKAERLKNFCSFLLAEGGMNFGKLKKLGTAHLREKLLAVKGIGPETADSILLYAFKRPVFVVDAYTRRIFSEHSLIRGREGYEEIRSLVERNFPRDERKLNQLHALLVETAKDFCGKKEKLCGECPLENLR